jgi:ABC-type Fe3+-siderophore transport system permease subunit
VESDYELNATTLQIYLELVKSGEPLGPREVMRMTKISSSGVAHRSLQKLVDLGLAAKDSYGRYEAKEKVGFKGYVWLGKNLVPHFVLLTCFFFGLLIAEIVVFSVKLSSMEAIETSFMLLMGVTAFSAVAFLVEGVNLRRKTSKIT